jgi:hypothetical protein
MSVQPGANYGKERVYLFLYFLFLGLAIAFNILSLYLISTHS